MHGRIVGKTVILEEGDVEWLQANFFGSIKNDRYLLCPEEALYLAELKKLDLYYQGKRVSFNKASEIFSKQDKRFWIRYVVYKDLRSKGYISKTALKYGFDFRVYDKGQLPGKEHSKWLCVVLYETDSIKAREMAGIGRVAHTVRKKVLFALVDAEFDVTYYEADWNKMG
jgi:tRNA-intron endonuclease